MSDVDGKQSEEYNPEELIDKTDDAIPISRLGLLLTDAVYMAAVVDTAQRFKPIEDNRRAIHEVVIPPLLSLLDGVAKCLRDANTGTLYFVGSGPELISKVKGSGSVRPPDSNSNDDDVFDLDFEAFDYDSIAGRVVIRPMNADDIDRMLIAYGFSTLPDSGPDILNKSSRARVYYLNLGNHEDRLSELPSQLSKSFIKGNRPALAALVHSDNSGYFKGLDLYYPFSLNKANRAGIRLAGLVDRKPFLQVRIPREYLGRYCPAAAINLEGYPVYRFTPDGLQPFSIGDGELDIDATPPIDVVKLLYKACVITGKFPLDQEQARRLSEVLTNQPIPENVRSLVAKRFWHAIKEVPGLWNNPSNLAIAKALFPELYWGIMMVEIKVKVIVDRVSSPARLCDHLAGLEPDFSSNNPILLIAKYIAKLEARSSSGTITPTRIGQIYGFLKRSTYQG